MTNGLITAVSVHVLAATTAVIFFYWLILSLLSKHGTTKHVLVVRGGIALITAVIVWATEFFILNEYYSGAYGMTTGEDVTGLIPLFTQTQALLLPLLLLVATVFFVGVMRKGERIMEGGFLKKVFVMLAIIGFIVSMALMFLGVMLP